MSVSVLPLCCFVTLGRLFKFPQCICTSMHIQKATMISHSQKDSTSFGIDPDPWPFQGSACEESGRSFFFPNEQWTGPCSVDYILHQKGVLHGNYIPRILLVVAALKTLEGEDVAGPSWRPRPDFILLDAFKPSEQTLIFLPASQLVFCNHCKGKMGIG